MIVNIDKNEDQTISDIVAFIEFKLSGKDNEFYYRVISGVHSEMDDRLEAHAQEQDENES